VDVTTDTGSSNDLVPASADIVGCRTAWVVRRQNAFVGIQQWAMELDVHWCYGFGLVRTITQVKGIQCCGPAWAFDRWIATDFPPAGSSSVTSFVQAQFKYSLSWFQGGKTPWIRITVHGDGTYESAWG
jgi:hypothetical protein